MNQQILIPRRITRDFILSNKNLTFLIGCSVHNEPFRGAALECKGLENCFGIPVRWSMCKSSGYFNDGHIRDIMIEVEVAFSKVPTNNPIIPFPKIGMGASRMNEFAPKVFIKIRNALSLNSYPNIKYLTE